jgi:hypothetical protein
MKGRQVAAALRIATRWVEQSLAAVDDFQNYSQRFGGTPGGNVFLFALHDALAHRGLTLDQFRAEQSK